MVVLPAAAAVSLGRCLREIVHADPRPRMTGTAAAATVRMLWKPVFCTCAIGFVWKLVSHLFAVPGGITSPPVLAGMALAVAVVVLIELLSETGFAVLRVYQILFPLVTGTFLLPTLLGVQFAPFASMLLFGFRAVSCCSSSPAPWSPASVLLPSTQVYALCGSRRPPCSRATSRHGLSPLAYDFALAANVLFVCAMRCRSAARRASPAGTPGPRRPRASSITWPWRRGRIPLGGRFGSGAAGRRQRHGRTPSRACRRRVRRVGVAAAGELALRPALRARRPGWARRLTRRACRAAGTATAPGADSIATLIERRHGRRSHSASSRLSPRQCEVEALALRGNNVPAIARQLNISKNTARHHIQQHLPQCRCPLLPGSSST
ncbi:MAG: LuxR C-terminal-related transcriptional regulator [Gordonibacter pamelaeae]